MRKMKSFALVCSIGIILVMAAVFLASPPQVWAQSATKSIELSFATHIPAKASPYHSAFLPWASWWEWNWIPGGTRGAGLCPSHRVL